MEDYGIQSTHEALKKRLLDYVKTAYFGKNDELRKQCEENLEQQGVLWQEPYIEANSAYKVINSGLENSDIIPKDIKIILKQLQDRKLGVFPNPYLHQIQAIEQFYQNKDLFIATGTGSGKTECFIWPMITKLAREAKVSSNTWNNRGIRAIMLYPMNALVADQMGRLRKMIGDRDNKFYDLFMSYCGNQRRPQFGMYTGRTPFPGKPSLNKSRELAETYKKDLLDKSGEVINKLIDLGKYPSKSNLSLFVDELSNGIHMTEDDDAELITRFEMQKNTPDILITNYSMLEYMLMRTVEQSLWKDTKEWLESSKDNKLLFIIDEAHMYKGASGGEVALLIRRFMKKLEIDRDRVQFILTSASIPSDGESEVLKFACDLTGTTIENNHFKIITGEKEKIDFSQSIECPATDLAKFDINSLYGDEKSKLNGVKIFAKIANLNIETCDFTDEKKVENWLYKELSLFAPLLRIMELTRSHAIRFTELAQKVFPNDDIDIAKKATSNILSVAPLAKNEVGQVLFPSRLHLMFRALQGIYACSNPNCTEKHHSSNLPIGKVYFGMHDDVCKCGGKIYELLNDRTCGALFFRGYIDEKEQFNKYVWNKKGLLTEQSFKEVHYYILPQNEKEKYTKNAKSVWLNSYSGRLEIDDSCSNRDHYVQLLYNDEISKDNPNLYAFKSCPKCKKKHLKLTDFATKGNEPFFHLVSEQLAIQPQVIFDDSELENNPNGGRKVLLFSDSRQRAATLAKELTSVADEEALKKAITVAAKELLEWAEREKEDPTMELLYVAFLKVAYENNLRFFFGDDEINLHEHMLDMKKQIQKQKNRGKKLDYKKLKDRKFKTVPELYSKYLLKHLCSNFRSLTDLGLCWIEPCEEIIDEVYDECDSKGIDIEIDELVKLFSAWANEILTDSYAYDSTIRYEIRKNITNIPRFGIDKQSKFKRDIVKVLKNNKYTDEDIDFIYQKFLSEFTSESTGDYKYNFLNPNCVVLKYGIDKSWYKCPRCGRVFPFTLWGKCALCGEGDPRMMREEEFEGLSFWREPIIASVKGDKHSLMTRINTEEHTAQLSHKDQRNNTWSTTEEYEMRFQNVNIDDGGPVDVLSCTTTMEVGIDIGSLTAVGLRNIPPMRENYQQRAGRAGRRSSAISTIVTYTDNGPHDNYYFNHPSRIISGEPSTPGIDIDNNKLIYRHLNVVYLTEFLLKNGTDVNELGIIDFMTNYYQSFINYMKRYVLDNKTILILVPNENIDLINLLKETFINELNELRNKVEQFEENYYNSNDVNNKIQKSVLDVLLEDGIFPTYSFPRNVVGFNIEDKYGKKLEQEPDRSLDLAISEYAPGRVLVVNKKTYKSGGIYSFHSKFNYDEMSHPATPYFKSKDYFNHIHFCTNKSCNWISFDKPDDGKCPFCGSSEIEEQNLLKPWGFAPLNGKNINDAEADVELSYAEAPSYSAPIEEDDMIQFEKYKSLRYSKLSNQPLVILNQGPEGKGFMICEDCGAAIPGDDGTLLENNKVTQPFTHPYKKEKCIHPHNKIINTFLGHKFLTDMILFEIKLDNRMIDTSLEGLWIKSAALTLSEAMALGASNLLDIDFNDLKNGYRIRHGVDYTYIDIYLFDSLSSGAGYSSMLENHIGELFEETEKVLECKNNCKTACHDCLKHYWNQRVQYDLDRHLAKQLLNWCKFNELPVEINFDEQVKLVNGLKEYILVDKYFDIQIDKNKMFVVNGDYKKQICIYPAMWNSQYRISSDVLAISDKLLLRALPNAYAKILTCIND